MQKDAKISTWDTTVFHDSGAGNHNSFREFGELGGRDELIPVCIENNIFNFYLTRSER